MWILSVKGNPESEVIFVSTNSNLNTLIHIYDFATGVLIFIVSCVISIEKLICCRFLLLFGYFL